MSSRTIFLSLIAIWTWGVTPTWGTITFSLEREVILPDSIKTGQVQFRDFDFDGTLDMLIMGDSTIATYSIAGDSTIDYFRKRDFGQSVHHRVGNLDLDGRPDVLVLSFFPFNSQSDSGGDMYAIPYLSSTGYMAGESLFVSSNPDPYMIYDHGSFEEAYLRDLDADNIDELYISYGRIIWNWTGTYVSYGLKYIIGCDSAVTIPRLPGNPVKFAPLFDISDTIGLAFSSRYSYYDPALPGIGDNTMRWLELQLYTHDSLLFLRNFLHLVCVGASYYNTNWEILSSFWLEDRLPSSSGINMIMNTSWGGISHDGFPIVCDTLQKQLYFNKFSLPDTLTEIWRLDIPSGSNIGYIFSDTAFGSVFFHFDGSRFYARDATSGQLIDSSAGFPYSPCKMIDYKSLSSETEPLASIIYGSEVFFYTIDYYVAAENSVDVVLPQHFSLGQPYPNPFNPIVIIPLSIPRKSEIEVSVFDILGRKVATIFKGSAHSGEIELRWDATEHSSGIYFIRATSDDEVVSRKLILLK